MTLSLFCTTQAPYDTSYTISNILYPSIKKQGIYHGREENTTASQMLKTAVDNLFPNFSIMKTTKRQHTKKILLSKIQNQEYT